LTIKKLILLGTGPAHLQVLAAFKAAPRADTDVHLVTPSEHVVHANMLAGMVSGHYSVEDCTVQLPQLLGSSAIKISYATATDIDTGTSHVQLSNGAVLHYDVLSLSANPTVDRDAVNQDIPGAKEHAVFAYPTEQFAKLWPQVLGHAEQRALRISVVGAQGSSAALAMALQHRLPHCRVTLIAGSEPPANDYPFNVQQRVRKALKQHNITVLQDSCTTIQADRIELQSGASVSCDIPLLTCQSTNHAWLRASGLALDAQGSLSTNAYGQSILDAKVFSVHGHAASASQALSQNVRALLDGQSAKTPIVLRSALSAITCGGRQAIASWASMSFQGRLAWRLQDVINQRWIRQYQI
jgi:NADH dehydrogenase FAD-containing subunit